MTEKVKSLSPLFDRIIVRKFGMYASSYLGNDIYFLMEAINLLISDLGEEYVRKRLKDEGKDWNEMKEKLDKLNKLANEVKIFYDPITDKKFDRKEINLTKVQAMFRRHFIRTASKLSLMQRDLYDILVFLVKSSSIQRQTIPSDAYKIIERGYGKIDLSKKPFGSGISSGVVKE